MSKKEAVYKGVNESGNSYTVYNDGGYAYRNSCNECSSTTSSYYNTGNGSAFYNNPGAGYKFYENSNQGTRSYQPSGSSANSGAGGNNASTGGDKK